MEYRNAEFKCYNNLKSFLLSQWSAATAVTPTVTALFYARGCAAPLQELHPSLHWKGLSFIARQSSRRHRNKLENVQHKKSVTDGRGGHVLESQVRGLRDGHRQRACLQREAGTAESAGCRLPFPKNAKSRWKVCTFYHFTRNLLLIVLLSVIISVKILGRAPGRGPEGTGIAQAVTLTVTKQ